MNWKEKLLKVEKEFGFHKKINWQPSINFIDALLIELPNNVELNVRAIYFLHNILVEEDYPGEEETRMINLLQKWFIKSKNKFANHSEYLFFIGKILHISEWLFGLEDNNLALDFQRKAMEKEPNNILYEWAYRFSCGDMKEGYLANELIENEKTKVDWLKIKGFPGVYVLEHIRVSNEEYLKRI